jgi:hypothetical protein
MACAQTVCSETKQYSVASAVAKKFSESLCFSLFHCFSLDELIVGWRILDGWFSGIM